jgi:Bacterial dipeptidyl-peptidase Sh3 domain
VIASHYAEPVERRLRARTDLRTAASTDSETILELEPGEPFLLLDDSLGWAWGYGGKDRLVGYLPSDALAAQ